MLIDVREVQPLNMFSLITPIPLPSVTEARLEHPLKADDSQAITVLGIAIDVRPVFEKAADPMIFTDAGMLTDVSPVPAKALSPTIRTEAGKLTDVSPAQFVKALAGISCT